MKRWLIAVLTLLSLFPGCARRPGPTLTLGVRTANDHAPFYLAAREGYYASLGLEVDLRVVPSNTEIVEAARRGDLQMGAIPVSSAIAAIAQGAPIVMVAMTGRGSDGLLVRRESDIHDTAGLRGKRIGAVRGSILDILLRESLERAGLDPERDTTLLYFNQLSDMIAALKTGQIDAASNTEPFLTQAERDGWGRILYYYTRDWPAHPCCVVFARRDLLQRQPEVVEAFLRAHVRAVEECRARPAETAQVIVETLGAFDPALVEASLDPAKMSIDYHIEPGEIERMAQEMHRLGLIDRLPSVEEMLDVRPLERALQ